MKPWTQRVGLVQTGDNSITARGAIVLVALGAVLVTAGLILWPRRHRNDDDGADEKPNARKLRRRPSRTSVPPPAVPPHFIRSSK